MECGDIAHTPIQNVQVHFIPLLKFSFYLFLSWDSSAYVDHSFFNIWFHFLYSYPSPFLHSYLTLFFFSFSMISPLSSLGCCILTSSSLFLSLCTSKLCWPPLVSSSLFSPTFTIWGLTFCFLFEFFFSTCIVLTKVRILTHVLVGLWFSISQFFHFSTKILIEWVNSRIREFFLKYLHLSLLHLFVESVDILVGDVLDGIISLRKCKDSDVVYLGRNGVTNIFYICILV